MSQVVQESRQVIVGYQVTYSHMRGKGALHKIKSAQNIGSLFL